MNNNLICLCVDIVCLFVSSLCLYHGYKINKKSKEQKVIMHTKDSFPETEIPELPFPACLLIG